MENIQFKDKGLEKVVKKELKKASKNHITAEDLLQIESILISEKASNGIQIPWESTGDAFNMIFPKFNFAIENSENSLWQFDMHLFKHIKSLHIYVHTENLEWLGGFNELQELYIYNSENKEWSFIEEMLRLELLFVHTSSFSNCVSIAKLCEKQQKLRQKAKQREKENLELSENKDAQYFRIDEFACLSNLGLIECKVADISTLACCKYIMDLNLSYNEITDISPLRGMNSIYYLNLSHNKIVDVSPLENLRGTYKINLRHNQISDISTFKKFKDYYIARLYLKHNNIADFSALKKLRLVDSDVMEYTKDARYYV